MKDLKNYTITLFGDSIPKGIMIEENKLKKIDKSVVKIIEDNYDIKIDNVSMFGQTLTKLHERNVFDSVLDKIGEDENHVALFFIGGNDSDYNWKEVAENPTNQHRPKTELSQFESNLNCNVEKMKTKCKLVLIISITPIDSTRFFDNYIGSLCDKNAVLQFLNNDITNIHRHQECYNIAMMKTAIRQGVPFIDVRSEFLSKRNYLEYLCDDGIHPNEKGHVLMANSIINQLDKNFLPD